MDLSLTVSRPEFISERDAVINGRGTHAYIIEGAKGIGKMAYALAVSCAYFCKSEHKPCFSCAGCRKVVEGAHPDVHIIEPEKNLIKVDDVREVIATLHETPYEGGRKVYIFKSFQLANESAQNALLKSLEEPPQAVTFFLLTENIYSLLDTVRSRCKKINLTPFDSNSIKAFLSHRFEGDVDFAVNACGGNIGNALNMLENEEAMRLAQLAGKIIKELSRATPVEVAQLIEGEKDNINELLTALEEQLFLCFQHDASRINLERLRAVEEAIENKKKNINSSLLVERLSYTLVKGGNKWQR